jgi:hypothetical protein
MIAVCVGDVNCGEVLAARDDPVQQSLRLLDREKGVHQDGVSIAVDERRRICHPHQLFLAGWQITSKTRAPYCDDIPAQAGVSGFNCRHHRLRDYLRARCEFHLRRELWGKHASRAWQASEPTRCSQNHWVAAASATGNWS